MDYGDPAAIALQRREILTAVQRLKDHPALLVWIVGNELNLGMTDTRVFDEVNALSQMIHGIDPNHPTTTAITAGREPLQMVLERAPDLDFVSIQLYGAMALLPRYAREWLAGRPFMVTEWGPVGHWESARTPWGAPIEMDSSTKARHYLANYRQLIEPHLDQCLGSYVFLWGQKQERTPTWYSMFTTTGESTAATDAIRMAWTGEWPANRAPAVIAALLDDRDASQEISLDAGTYRVAVSAKGRRRGLPVVPMERQAREQGNTGRRRLRSADQRPRRADRGSVVARNNDGGTGRGGRISALRLRVRRQRTRCTCQHPVPCCRAPLTDD